jgi:hypothetical protein
MSAAALQFIPQSLKNFRQLKHYCDLILIYKSNQLFWLIMFSSQQN